MVKKAAWEPDGGSHKACRVAVASTDSFNRLRGQHGNHKSAMPTPTAAFPSNTEKLKSPIIFWNQTKHLLRSRFSQ